MPAALLRLTRAPLAQAPLWLEREAAQLGDKTTLEHARSIIAAAVAAHAVALYRPDGLGTRKLHAEEIDGRRIDWRLGALTRHEGAPAQDGMRTIQLIDEEAETPLECDLIELGEFYRRCRTESAASSSAAMRGRPPRHAWEEIAMVMGALAVNEGLWHDPAALTRRTLDHIAELHADAPDARDVRRRAMRACEIARAIISAPGK